MKADNLQIVTNESVADPQNSVRSKFDICVELVNSEEACLSTHLSSPVGNLIPLVPPAFDFHKIKQPRAELSCRAVVS